MVKYFCENAPKFLLQKNIFTNNLRGQERFSNMTGVTKQRNMKFVKIIHRQNKLVYGMSVCVFVCD